MKQEAKMFGIAALAIGAWETIKFVGVKAIRNRRNQVQEPAEQQQPAVQEKPETPAADPQPEDKK